MATHEAEVEVIDLCHVCEDDPAEYVILTTAGETERWCAPCFVADGETVMEFVVSMERIGHVAAPVSESRRRALRRVDCESTDAKLEARRVIAACEAVIDRIEHGYHAEFGARQSIFDMIECLERRKSAVHFAMELGCEPEAVTEKSKGMTR